jgi:hypothetical protein
MNNFWIITVLVLCIGYGSARAESRLIVSGRGGTGDGFSLIGPDARQQLLVTLETTDADPRDVSGEVTFRAEPAGIVEFIDKGYLKPSADGKAMITAELDGASPVNIEVTSERVGAPLPINFANEIAPILTRNGCNGGGCHGKSGGQNGFRLSLLGFEPWNDYDRLLREGRGRRISLPAPESSLLITKATGEIPHGGGARIDVGSPDYQRLIRWIEMGTPYGSEEDPTIERIEVAPKQRVAKAGGRQQLSVTAHYSDKSSRDVTREVQYDSNDEQMATVTKQGLVEMNSMPGSASVMVRFQEHVDVFLADIPLGEPVTLPEPKNFIDEKIFAKLKLLGLPPSAPTDDATFLRRVSLDIVGRLPDAGEAEAFAVDTNPDKRAQKIDELLESPQYADWFANKWSSVLRNKRTSAEFARGTFAFHDWVRNAIQRNQPFNEFVNELVTASGEIGQSAPVAWYRAVSDQKEQMQDIAQVFLGIRIQCAQCHHHPYEKWSQDDYYGMTAFFSTLQKKPGELPGEEMIFHKRKSASAQNPGTKQNRKPTPLGAAEMEIPEEEDPRQSLAAWLTDTSNPFFAKMFVNRYWKHFFGRGIVEPEDDMRVTNPATHPELLDGLARHFVESGFDMKAVIRLICNSHTYQLSSEPNQHNANDRQNFSRYNPRRLPAEVLLDAINQVAKSEDSFPNQEPGTSAVALPDDQYTKDVYFLSVFGRPEMDSACECERTIDGNLAQSLHLVNSSTIQSKLTNGQGRAALLAAEVGRQDVDKIKELYLAAFARPPRESELEIALRHFETKRKRAQEKDPKANLDQSTREGYEDLLWVLISTKEFLFNH